MTTCTFNEQSWIKLIFLLADTQQWIDELASNAFEQLPVDNKKKLFRNTYRLTPKAMAHILERHYYKIPRHPGTGKFNISLPTILDLIRDAGAIDPVPVPGTLNMQRILHNGSVIGTDNLGAATVTLTVITGPGGSIITAFPGILSERTDGAD